MKEIAELKRSAIRYWERRRIIYNVALVPPSLLVYLLNSGIAEGVGDPRRFGLLFVGLLFVLSAVAANICYSFAYALEFIFLNDRPVSGWKGSGRQITFICGTLLAMILAAFGGQQIYWIQYAPHLLPVH